MTKPQSKAQRTAKIYPVITILFLGCFYSYLIYSQPQQSHTYYGSDNPRENCRLMLAGIYISRHDELTNAKESIDAYEKQIKALNEKLSPLQEALASLEAKTQKSIQDMKQKDTIHRQQNEIRRAKTEFKSLASSRQNEYNRKKSDFDEFKAKLEKVYVVKKSANKAEYDTAYPIALEYRSPCPEKVTGCPLPRKDRVYLKDVLPEKEFPKSCFELITQEKF